MTPPQPLLLCLSHLRWDFVHQRPQHLMERAAATYRVIYWEEPEFHDGASALRIAEQKSGVVVVTPLLSEGLDEGAADTAQRALLDSYLAELGGAPPSVAWFYTPMALAFAGHLKPGVTIYDCMDELSLFAGASSRLLLLERRLLRAADLVFTGGRSLQRAKQPLHAAVHCFPSAVDRAHFATARETSHITEPADLARIPHPRIGFFGVIDERLDRALLAEVAAERPDWHFVMLGPVAKLDPDALPVAANIHYLGAKPYASLPAYLAHWDAGWMPFALNDATRFISPTKTPEYLAAGLRLVSTPIADVAADWGRSDLVAIAPDAPASIAALEAALAERDATWRARADAALAPISWDDTWARMQALIEAKARPAAAPSRPHVSAPIREPYDWLVVGAGFAGAVLAERIARQRGETVLVIDRRPHIAGNAYDLKNEHGILYHQYGPHIFHTNAQLVVDYLSRFTAWRPYEHRVLAAVDAKLVPIPINLTTVNTLYGLDLTSDQLDAWFAERAEPVETIRTSEDVVVSKVGRELYEKFFRGYTRKQWGLDPSELDRAVTARVPTRTSTDDRYFNDSFQAMPRDGYTAMFARMLDHPNITVGLGEDFASVRDRVRYRRLIWTGPIDEYFGFAHGKLPYRSLRFQHETLAREWFQPVGVVNYPQTEDYTRITEYKHLTGQTHPHTTITYEYPSDAGDPYYPIPRPANAEQYRRYQDLAEKAQNTRFVGRLATYQYMNMDQVVGQALATFRRIEEQLPRARRSAAPTRLGGAAATPEVRA